MQTTLSANGEILIPARLLECYGLSGGAAVILEPRDGEIALRPADPRLPRAHLIQRGGDALLEAPPSAPPMTPENVKRMLENWP